MKKCYVIGNPIKHSLSPIIFNYLFKKNNINAKYSKYNPKNETDFFKFIKNENFYGLNITIPYKQKAYKIIDNKDGHADIKSINCIKKNKESLTGYNTDEYGFLKTIDKWQSRAGYRPCRIKSQKAIVATLYAHNKYYFN